MIQNHYFTKFVLFTIITCLFFSCWLFEEKGDISIKTIENVSAPPDMVLLHPPDTAIYLGVNDSSVPYFPRFAATLSNAYWIDKHEITQNQFASLMTTYSGYTRNFWDGGPFDDPELPAIGISWNDAVLFCNARSRFLGLDTLYIYDALSWEPTGPDMKNIRLLTGKVGVALPTEVEWEYAAVAATRYYYPWGNTWDAEKAKQHTGLPGPALHKAGSLSPNTLGVFDMLGNVNEWTQDSWTEYYPFQPLTDYRAENKSPLKVLRGNSASQYPGEHADNYHSFHIKHRYKYQASMRANYNGFRTVITIRRER